MARDQLNSSMRCAKFMLIIVSFMFALTAILLIMVGTTIQTIFGDFSQFIDDHFSSPPALLIAIGFILLFVATLGAYGAVKESVMLINLYGFSLFLVFILEVAAAIAAFVMQTQVRGMLMRTMNESIQAYDDNVYVAAGVDFMQYTLGCCGVNSPVDWKLQNDTNVENKIELPPSCCEEYSMDEMNFDECVRPYDSGCLPRMDFIISQSTMLIATGATTVAFVQVNKQ
ncbi:PREDICTED: tetraspanin-7 [Rhagoletis zephyria]|uniref:tetraspanin-7 n=1 Tax=Rhagoletis zephyria TaxID=28612 RepID=UPI0008115272|nr:PREDICTED: tetraspanin-7 [Rhagoletis zephyria]XP_017479143.1 PREDICTED: tetraspanin-7 [Rhagoletis zephyria]